MHQCDHDDLLDLHQSLSLDEKVYLFLPINDGMNTRTDIWRRPGGGSHYSLLFATILQSDIIFFHFDSYNMSNETVAKMVSKRIRDLLQIKSDRKNEAVSNPISSSSTADIDLKNEGNFFSCATLQQANQHDCGLYTLTAIEAILKSPRISEYFQHLRTSCSTFSSKTVPLYQSLCEESILSFTKKEGFANELRKNMAEDIELLSKEYLSKNR